MSELINTNLPNKLRRCLTYDTIWKCGSCRNESLFESVRPKVNIKSETEILSIIKNYTNYNRGLLHPVPIPNVLDSVSGFDIFLSWITKEEIKSRKSNSNQSFPCK